MHRGISLEVKLPDIEIMPAGGGQRGIKMAFDGVTIANVVSELKKELMGGRLYKIAQPEADELLLTVRQPKGQARLLLSW